MAKSKATCVYNQHPTTPYSIATKAIKNSDSKGGKLNSMKKGSKKY